MEGLLELVDDTERGCLDAVVGCATSLVEPVVASHEVGQLRLVVGIDGVSLASTIAHGQHTAAAGYVVLLWRLAILSKEALVLATTTVGLSDVVVGIERDVLEVICTELTHALHLLTQVGG